MCQGPMGTVGQREHRSPRATAPEGQVLSEGQESRSGLSAGKRAPVMGLNDEAELSMELLRNTNYPGSYTRSFSAHPKQLLPDGPCVVTQLGRHQQCGTLLAVSNQPGNATRTVRGWCSEPQTDADRTQLRTVTWEKPG